MGDCTALRQTFPSVNIPLDCCNQGDQYVQCVGGRITKISFPNVKITGPFPNLSTFTSLLYLDLSQNSFQGEIPSSLWSLTELRQLINLLSELHSNKFEGPMPASYGQLTKVTRFDLTFNSFSGSIPDTYGGMSSLKEFYVNNNKLTGPVPDSFLSLKSLIDVRLLNNLFYGDLTEKFQIIAPTARFQLQNNYFSGTVPSSLDAGLLTTNCFKRPGLNNQRPQADCDAFAKSIPTNPPAPSQTVPPSPSQPTSPGSPGLDNSSMTSSISTSNTSALTSNLSATSSLLSNPETPSQNPLSPSSTDPVIANGVPSPKTENSGPSSNGPSSVIIAVVVVLVLIAVVAAAVFFIVVRRRRSKQREALDATVMFGAADVTSGGITQLRHAHTITNYTPATAVDTKDSLPVKDSKGDELFQANESNGDNLFWESQGIMDSKKSTFAYQPSDTIPLSSSGNNEVRSINAPATPVTFVNELTNQPIPSPVTTVNEISNQPLIPPPRQSSTSKQQEASSGSESKSTYSPTNSTHHTSISMFDASTWSPSQVAQWLESVDVSPRLAAILKENGVTGYQLLLLTDERLVEMGVELQLSRRIVMEAVETLRAGNAGARGHSAPPVAPPQYS
ncbi:hypothetical protein HDU97_002134 [Phlyctochytrium planicorne]|nr:hypothetical protein HDU97_002134 [Phlyctochytrium planicorne]